MDDERNEGQEELIRKMVKDQQERADASSEKHKAGRPVEPGISPDVMEEYMEDHPVEQEDPMGDLGGGGVGQYTAEVSQHPEYRKRFKK